MNENRDYCSYFSVVFETTSEFAIVFFKIDIDESGVDRFTESLRKTEGKYEFGCRVKDLLCK